MRASLKALAVLFVPSLVSAQAVPVRPVGWAAMHGEEGIEAQILDIVELGSGPANIGAGVKFVHDILRSAQ